MDNISQDRFEYATYWRRTWATGVDVLLCGTILFLFMVLTTIVCLIGDVLLHQFYDLLIALAAIAWVLGGVAIFFGYFAGFESSKRMATPGKMLFGITVRKTDGNRISFARSSIRLVLKSIAVILMVAFNLPAIAIFYALWLWDPSSRNLVDHFMGTNVLRKLRY